MQQQKIHNGRNLLKSITNINKKLQSSEETYPDRATEASQSIQDRPHASKTTAAQSSKFSKTSNEQPGPSHKAVIQQPGPSCQKTQHRGKYIPSKVARKPLQEYKKEITTALRRQYNIPDRNIFRYYYDDAIKVIHDFKIYKQETSTNPVQTSKQRNERVQTMANNVKLVWREVDINMGVFPRDFLNDPDLIEDNFYRPHLNALIANINLPKAKQTVHIQASTIKSKLCSLAVIKIRYNSLSRIIPKVQELNSSLKMSIDQREQVISKHKSDTLIAANKFQSYGNSKHIKETNQDLYSLSVSPKTVTLTRQKAIDVRDYLMVSLTYFNCLRVSNLMNITLTGINNIKPHDEIDGAHVLTNTKYKTSVIYGPKIILLSNTHVDQIKLYIQKLRPFITKDDKKIQA